MTLKSRFWLALFSLTVPPAALHQQQALAAEAAARPQFAVVANSALPASDLTFAELRRVLVGEHKYWQPDLPVVIVVRSTRSPERDVLLKKIYGMSESKYKQYWVAKIFRDEVTSGPRTAATPEAVLKIVTSTPGAVALVNADVSRKGVKTLKVDGKLPGEADYPLW